LLQEVVVTQKMGPIRIKGDTTEFVADSFKVQLNASVEDLLKRLPTIQVDKNGQITAQGQAVKKVLVDGEEFFGDDPTLVTRNLRADMIDKVQIYDKKSDQAAFTGIDDGIRDKTINLKIKENQKKGAFGKLVAGGGTNGFHESQAMLNKFKGNEKIAFYGIIDNTGKAGLGWQDAQNYGGGSDNDDIGWNGNYNGQGIPLSQSAGLHYDNKWKDGKYAANGNYKFNKLNVTGSNGSVTQNNLPDAIQYSSSNEDFRNRSVRNKVNGTFEVQLDSFSSLKINVEGSWNHKNTFSDYTTQTLRQDSSLLNNSERTRTNTGDNNAFNSNLLWLRKFRKKGRTLSFNLSEEYFTTDINGYLNSTNHYYNGAGALDSTAGIDQFKTTNGNYLGLDTKLTYTEPLSKYASMVANYGIVIDNNDSKKLSFNPSGAGDYDLLDSTYSNNFHFNQLMHRAGLDFIYNRKSLNFIIGSNVGFNKYDQNDLFGKNILHRYFVNWYPQASVKYGVRGKSQFALAYQGNTVQPSTAQIQPVSTNDDPLNVYMGNENLKPSFQNNISLNYSSYNVLNLTIFHFYSTFSPINNAITTNTVTDYNTGKTTYQYVNVNGNFSGNISVSYNTKFKKWDLNYGGSFQSSWGRNINYVNQQRNSNNSGNFALSLDLLKNKPNKYSLTLEAQAAYNTNESSLQKEQNNNYWSYALAPDIDVYLPLKFQVHTDLNYTIQQKTATFTDNLHVALWNAWIGKKFFRNEALELRIAGNDLLNQNRGIRRNAYNNIITQNIYTTIRRYFMLSVIWNFKTGMNTANK
jgi:hypothetical protein